MASRFAGKVAKVSLIKQAWNEIPEIVAGSCVMCVGLVFGCMAVYRARQLGPNLAMHKYHYTVIRDTEIRDDPTLKKYN